MNITAIEQVRALGRKILVFSVPVRRRMKSGLYVANARRDALFHGEDVWILSVGPRVLEHLKIGQRGIISDGMELENSDLDMWDALKNTEMFKELKAYVEECDGEVRTQIITEDSLIAVYD